MYIYIHVYIYIYKYKFIELTQHRSTRNNISFSWNVLCKADSTAVLLYILAQPHRFVIHRTSSH